jgi:penicillin-binding protein 1B
MAVKVKIAQSAFSRLLTSGGVGMLLLKVALGLCAVALLVGFSVFGYFNFKYRGLVDERLKQPIFADTAKIYAAPREVRPGQKLSVRLLAGDLRQAGYTTDGTAQASPLGTFSEGVQSITVQPGPQSYHAPDSATIHVSGGQVESIVDAKGQPLSSYSSSLDSAMTPTGPNGACSPTVKSLPTWCRPCWRSKTVASLSTAASITEA